MLIFSKLRAFYKFIGMRYCLVSDEFFACSVFLLLQMITSIGGYQFGSRSSIDVVIPHWFTEQQKNVTVSMHNEIRKSVSPPAADMLKLAWDDQLEKHAVAYSRTCPTFVNTNTSYSGYLWVGENMYISANVNIDEHYIKNVIQRWYNEAKNFHFSTRQCQPTKDCGHYTQIVWSITHSIGCGMTTCKNFKFAGEVFDLATVVVCNYVPANLYQAGPSCSKCQEKDICDNNLCLWKKNNQASRLPSSLHYCFCFYLLFYYTNL
ncbi:GLIPR1-like protein 1 isoform X2 [Clavelina lepadiformis]|uniref:GLIPR1-like protein 1 isoform X2 n=1 Tax=Clavelina lepadiformis TaxID=159417 RepID=UPI00404168C3